MAPNTNHESKSEKEPIPKASSSDAQPRVMIENLQPSVNNGSFPIKRTIGEEVQVTADIFADGHDVLSAVLRVRTEANGDWIETPMKAQPNDLWTARFKIEKIASYEFTAAAWVDVFATWRRDLVAKLDAKQDIQSDLLEGARLIEETAARAPAAEAKLFKEAGTALKSAKNPVTRESPALTDEFAERMNRFSDRTQAFTAEYTQSVLVERVRARYGAWYEMFPRSSGTDDKKSATFRQAEARLPGIAGMGFDVLYLPPVHPIGKQFRKGPNNSTKSGPGDPGSPWAIGGSAGGHKSIAPELGTLDDFDHFVKAAAAQRLEIALDIAFQCSPDHPYVREHPEWFHHRPDGTIKYAENPPKKYEDIYPFDFECAERQALWNELLSVVLFWIDHGVHIFRVDNPHTKPFPFWRWLISKARDAHPDVVFLAEAFARPKIMRYLAKVGFSQSYSYFTWRNTKPELTEYFTELNQTPVREYFRPNLFANTPDIFHEFLQYGGRPAFQIRLFLAATLGASYGIYGPAFELCEARAIAGTEDYQDSEKYQVRVWDWERPGHIKEWVRMVNQIRRANPALHHDHRLRFYETNNPSLLCYAKTTPDFLNVILVVINLDPHHIQEGYVQLVPSEFGLEPDQAFQVHDFLSNAHYLWRGSSNYVRLDPGVCPAHIFQVRHKIKTEKDFDYFG